ncbi:type II secretion system protein [Vibrio splendidus]
MKRQGGFTLIELVVVIVILGILAVTAAPRFLNLQGDARDASLQGLKGAMDGASGIVFGKAAIDGVETASAATGTDVEGISTIFGYPRATEDGIGAAVVGLGDDWDVAASVADTSITYTFSGSTDVTCAVRFDQATGTAVSEAASATVIDTGCN